MNIIPAIDLINGQCVRLTGGDYRTATVYSTDPVDMARRFEDAGLRYLHLVDLDGAKAKKMVNHSILEKITSATRLHVDVGGGIQSTADLQLAFNCGASKITAGSIVVKNENLFLEWLETYGPEKIILGADCRAQLIATNAWETNTSLHVLDYISRYLGYGIRQVICTDIEQDGKLTGPSFDLYKQILNTAEPLELYASGGISCMEDLWQLKEIGCNGAIIGKAIYEGRITLKELEELC